jgi:hypothetical protein
MVLQSTGAGTQWANQTTYETLENDFLYKLNTDPLLYWSDSEPQILKSVSVVDAANYGTWDGENFWSSNYYAHSISKINQNGEILATYYFDSQIVPLQLAYDGRNIWIASADDAAGHLLRFDTVTATTTGDYILNPSAIGLGGVQGVLWDGEYVWAGVAQAAGPAGSGLVAKIDPVTGNVVASSTGHTNVNGMVVMDITESTGLVRYVFAANSGFISKINASDMTYSTTSSGGETYRIATDGKYIYGASFSEHVIRKFLASDMSLTDTWPSGNQLNTVAFDGRYIWTAGDDLNITIHDRNTGDIVYTLANAGQSDLVFDGTYMWSVIANTDIVNKISTGDQIGNLKIAERISVMDREGNASIFLSGTSSGSSFMMSKFGIGTSTPSTALFVVGTSTMDGLNVSNLASTFLATDSSGNVISTTSPLTIVSNNYPTFSYASSTFVTYNYASSTFPSFSYASSTFATGTTWWTQSGTSIINNNGGSVSIGTTTADILINSSATSTYALSIVANSLSSGRGINVSNDCVSGCGGDLMILEAKNNFGGDLANFSGGNMTGRGLYMNGGTGGSPQLRVETAFRTGSVVEISGGYGSQHNAKGLSIDMSTSLNSTGTVYGLHVAKSGVSSTSVGGYFSATGGTEGNYGLIVSSGLVGIGTTTPTANLTASGTIRFTSLGSAGGNLVTDTDGNVTVSSDERLKDIQSDYERGLVDIMKIVPINYKWKPETGYETTNVYTGFSAQNLSIAIPEAVATSSSGYLTIADRPILAALVNAVKEIGSFINKIENGIAYLKDIVAETFAVGSQEKPSGITMYDEDTKLPYCVKIKNGLLFNESGVCPIYSATSTINNIATVINAFNDNTSSTTEQSSSTVSTSTEITSISTSTPEVPIETATTTEEIISEVATTTEPILPTEEIATTTSEVISEPVEIIPEVVPEIPIEIFLAPETATTTP